MDVRPASTDDGERIREVVTGSMQMSYSLSPIQIETIVENAFAGEAIADRIDDADDLVLVAEAPEQEVVGVAVVEVDGEGVLRWLHVDPDHRGEGAGTALFERVEAELGEDTPLVARILESAAEGGQFCEQFGLQERGGDRIEFGDEEFSEVVYGADGRADDSNEPAVEVPERVAVDGDSLPVDRDDAVPGRESPFFHVYTDETFEERYGFFCSNCGSTDVSADGLDRLQCGNCGNEHRADEWDAAYL